MPGERLNCAKARAIDLVNYLSQLGYEPQKIKGANYWYLSPLREERTASFKVDRTRNLWYDHGMGKGGNLIDFGTLYHNCSTKDLLEKLSAESIFSLHPPQLSHFSEPAEPKIIITDERRIAHPLLTRYLQSRNITIDLANRYCNEVDFLLNNKKHTTIGFKNEEGGYELRNHYFKGSSTPKAVTYLNKEKKELLVFEGLFSFLSYKTLVEKERHQQLLYKKKEFAFLILNSLSLFEKSRALMEKHQRIHLFLDRDKAGLKWMLQALVWSRKYTDQSFVYKGYKDLNEFLKALPNASPKTELKKGRRFRL